MVTDATTTYRTVAVDGLNIFYREAGARDAPTILLLHGFPSSSAMFTTLIPRLADRYHLIAPDYPGFGLSDAPPPDQYGYTFDHIAETIGHFAEQLGLAHYTLFMQDYGGPIGMRLATVNPERVDALIVQNAVHSEQGLGPAWVPRRMFWQDRAAHETSVIDAFLSLETTRARHIGTSPHPEHYNPEEWLAEHAHLSKPGQREIQSDLFYDYRTNVASYPAWQSWLRRHQPPTLVFWGRYDPSFAVDGAAAWQQDVPAASVHILDAGHFALDEQVDTIAALVCDFLANLQPD
jgi:pimeloyl-ACP methyl ester carboxylesterase